MYTRSSQTKRPLSTYHYDPETSSNYRRSLQKGNLLRRNCNISTFAILGQYAIFVNKGSLVKAAPLGYKRKVIESDIERLACQQYSMPKRGAEEVGLGGKIATSPQL